MTTKHMLMLVLVSGRCVAANEALPADSGGALERRGLMFTYGIGSHRSSASAFADGGYVVQVMIGYCITSSLYVNVGVLTGSDRLAWEGYPGGLRQLSVGGARFQAEWFPISNGTIRPFLTLAWDMMTVLTREPGKLTSGFNGGGPRIAAGASWEVSTYLAAAIQGAYSVPRFWNSVNNAPPASVPFAERMVSLEFTVSFFPNISP